MSGDRLRKIGGFVTVEVIRDTPRGPKVIARRYHHNVILNVGKKQLWRMVTGKSTKIFDTCRIGTCGVAATSGQTNCISPVAATITTVDDITVASGRTCQWVWSWPSGGGSLSVTGLEECVILNQATSPGGSALMRSTYTSVNKTTADKFRITYMARIDA